MKCSGFPRPGTEGAGLDGITRATCLCGRVMVWIQDVPNRADSWRHYPRRRGIR